MFDGNLRCFRYDAFGWSYLNSITKLIRLLPYTIIYLKL